jgi:hypothetical protein
VIGMPPDDVDGCSETLPSGTFSSRETLTQECWPVRPDRAMITSIGLAALAAKAIGGRAACDTIHAIPTYCIFCIQRTTDEGSGRSRQIEPSECAVCIGDGHREWRWSGRGFTGRRSGFSFGFLWFAARFPGFPGVYLGGSIRGCRGRGAG